MNISSVGHPHHHAHAAVHRDNSSNHVSTTPFDANRQVAVEAADDVNDSKETEATSSHHNGPKGVVGLLQSGHFKGVAAVRLSINFNEQLSGLSRESVGVQMEEAAASLDEQVAGALKVYSEGANEEQVRLVTEAQETFSHAIRTAVEGFRNGESSQDDTLSGMQTAFDKLMVAVEASFASKDPVADEQDTDDVADSLSAAADDAKGAGQAATGDVVEEAVAVPYSAVAGIDAYLATIGQVFNSFLEGLQSDMDAINAIPEFTVPKGNGAAFDKFMAMYREIIGIAMPVDAGTQLAAGIDQQV